MILVDTNVLHGMAQPSHSMHIQALTIVGRLRFQNETLCVVPQNLYEFWVVATRPLASNGLGMTSEQADTDLTRIIEQFRLIRDERAIFEPWR